MLVDSGVEDIVILFLFIGVLGNYFVFFILWVGFDLVDFLFVDVFLMNFFEGLLKLKVWKEIWGLG